MISNKKNIIDKNKLADYLKDHKGYEDLIINGIECFITSKLARQFDFCQVCDAPLSSEDLIHITPYDFIICCKEHRQYANAFQISKIRELLGIKEYCPFLEQIKKEV